MAEYVFDKLRNDPNLVVKMSTKDYHGQYRYMSSVFKNGEITPEPDYTKPYKEIPHDLKTYASAIKSEHFRKNLPKMREEYFDPENEKYLVGVLIMDPRWNNNGYLWNAVLQILIDYSVEFCVQ